MCKKLTLLLLPVITLLCINGCSAFYQSLEFRELTAPDVRFVHYSDGPTLKISGTCARAGYVVEKVLQIREGRTLLVKVLISPFSRDGAGTAFETEIVLDELDFVYFGEQRELIWRRHPPPASAEPLPGKRPVPVFEPEE